MAEASKNKGNEFYKAGKYQEAIEQYTFAIECDPKNHVFWTNRATTYAALQKWDRVLRDAEKAISLNPSWGKGYLRKGQALSEQGNLKEAVKIFKEGLGVDPDNKEMQTKLQETERKWKGNMSAAALKKEEGNELFKVGKIQEALKKYDEAMNLLKLPDELNLKAHLHSNRAHCWVQLYEPTKVVAECGEALNIEPDNTKALLRRGFAYESLEKYRQAYDDFNKVMSLDPSANKAVHAANRVKEALKRMGKSVN